MSSDLGARRITYGQGRRLDIGNFDGSNGAIDIIAYPDLNLASMLRPAVFLDRDGVLAENQTGPDGPMAARSLAEFRVVSGAAEAVQLLKACGFLTIVVTNQPDVARGRISKSEVEAMHSILRQQVGVDEIRTCFHDDGDNCVCRKPKPGMLLEAASKYGIDFHSSYLIGDRWRDVNAGRAVGCFTLLIDYGLPEQRIARPDKVVSSLADAVKFILLAAMRSPGGARMGPSATVCGSLWPNCDPPRKPPRSPS